MSRTKTKADCDARESGELVAVLPQNRTYALGLAAPFLASAPGYADARFADGLRILSGLIARGHYFFVLKDDQVVGFLGWALAGKEQGEAWLRGETELSHEDCVAGDSIIINVWHARTPEAQKFMLQHLRGTQGDKVMVFAKRHYADGRVRPVRLPLG